MKDLNQFLQQHFIQSTKQIIYNPSYQQLRQYQLANPTHNTTLTNLNAIAIDTGKFTGRSPKDKYIVKDNTTQNTIWWNETAKNDNKPISPQIWQHLQQLVGNYLSNKTLYVIDAICGASDKNNLKVRFIAETPWQAHFVKNMFIPMQPTDTNRPIDFTVIAGCGAVNNNWQQQGLNSENFIAFNLSQNVQLIGGTWYAGEMKKGLFSVMNYLLPQKNVASMHCAANVSKNGNVNLFFGLSGTGKTTLSSDSNQQLIGDDEHGWDDEGVFNLEGGCYAKVINLSQQNEPDIYNAIKENALLENVVIKDNNVNFSDSSKTENTRVSYPINHINNIVKPKSKGTHAKNIIFLTADAFGVLPPVAVLKGNQIPYYFLSGFTAKMAGTEIGVTKPTPTFSACFGAAFLTLNPITYANILLNKINTYNANVYLVNTGWNGENKRISIANTRTIINAILNNTINNAPLTTLPVFNLQMPTQLHNLNSSILNPSASYSSTALWHSKAVSLATLFIENFKKFNTQSNYNSLIQGGPKL